ncbi:MAG TPA: GrpB family protein [Planctomycetota bacterium]|nr:GrpB family protein [Planctomycetota bacterium]
MSEPIIVTLYDPRWPLLFRDECERIRELIKAPAEIEHVGSTAVEGLAAKPVIDILIGLPRMSDAPLWIALLQKLGYEYVPEFEKVMPERRFFRRFENGVRAQHIHMVERGGDFWIRHIAFRDYLRTHPDEALAYGRLKLELAENFRDDREAYMDGKDAFIKALEQRAMAEYGRGAG